MSRGLSSGRVGEKHGRVEAGKQAITAEWREDVIAEFHIEWFHDRTSVVLDVLEQPSAEASHVFSARVRPEANSLHHHLADRDFLARGDAVGRVQTFMVDFAETYDYEISEVDWDAERQKSAAGSWRLQGERHPWDDLEPSEVFD